jgi:hypothetical protein
VAVVAFAGFAIYGQPRAGLSIAVGLVLGGFNGLMAAKTAEVGIAFRFLSLARIGVLSVLALAVGVLLQPSTAWLTLVGLGVSQFLLAALAARSVLQR